MTVVAEPEPLIQITEPGVWNIDEESYFADPVPGGSLSSTGAKLLLRCPAKFAWQRTHPRPPKHEFDLGHAAHLLTLGKGATLVVVDAPNWMTKAAKEAKAQAYDAGKVPLLPKDWEQVQAMHAVLVEHWAASLFTGGIPEQVLVWRDEQTGIMCRAMLDYRRGGRIVDYKTSSSADPDGWDDAVARFDYHMQASHYSDGVRALSLNLGDGVTFLHVVQEVEPPYLVTVSALDPDYLEIGARRMARAREMFRDCTASGIWPGYAGTDDIITTSPPRWVRVQEEQYI